MNTNDIIEKLNIMFPNAGCELIYHNPFEFLICVILSAQTTDKAVNEVSRVLFEKYSDCYKLKDADICDVKKILEPLGLSSVKASYLIEVSKKIALDYGGNVPNDFNSLTKLKGVGRKTANVFLQEICKIPALAVDTHVNRVSKRLGLVKDDCNIIEVEEELKKLFNKKDWIRVHHLLLFLGRYKCKSKNPMCMTCLLKQECKNYLKKD